MAEKAVFQSSFFFTYPSRSAAGAVITITRSEDGSLAVVYADLDGSSTVSNPSRVPQSSLFRAFLDYDRYDIVVTDGQQEIRVEGVMVGVDGRCVGDVGEPGDVAAGDFVIVYDASAEAFKKLALSSLQALQP